MLLRTLTRVGVWSLLGLLFGGAVLLSILTCWALAASERDIARDGTSMALAQLTRLEPGIESSADAMQRLFPEGRVFTLALYASAWVNIGRDSHDPALRVRALNACRDALELIESTSSRATFRPAGGLRHGMFYEGWSNWVRVGCLRLGPKSVLERELAGQLRESCGRIASALATSGPFVDSYRGAAWPADSVVGVASLRECARRWPSAYRAAVERWLHAAWAQVDVETGLLPHAIPARGARGSSAALMSTFLAEIDPELALVHYAGLRRHFATLFAGLLPALREYPHGRSGDADVDSGPIVLGVSGPASVVGLAAARAHGDASSALALRSAVEAIGLPLEDGSGRYYGFGVLPVGEAFLAWASTVRPVAPAREFGPSPYEEYPGRFRSACALALAGSAALALAAVWMAWRRIKARWRPRPESPAT